MRQLQNKRAIITGAASGIGRALAIQLARQGTHVCLWDKDCDGLDHVARQCRAIGVQSIEIECDLNQPANITRCIDHVLDQWTAIDVLINNAGVGLEMPTHQISADQWQTVLNVNLLAPVQLTHELLPVLLSQHESHLVNISSMLGICPAPRAAAYCTTKFGLTGLSESLRMEYRRTGLGVTNVCPGFVQTGLFDQGQGGDTEQPIKQRSKWLFTTPEKVATKVVHGIRRNRRRIVITPLAHLVSFLYRHAPVVMDGVTAIGRRKPPLPAVDRQADANRRKPKKAA